MKQNTNRKLTLGKKTIARLNEADAKTVKGGSYSGVSVIHYSVACQTDFTRPGTSVMTGGTSIHP